MKLNLKAITDLVVRDCIDKIQTFLNGQTQLTGFRFIEITTVKAETNFKFPHLLGFQPKDVVVTSVTGTGSVTWNYSLFDTQYLNISTSGACTVRAYVGTHQEQLNA